MIEKLIQNLHDIINTLEGCLAGETVYPDTLLGYAREALGYLEDDTPITEEFLDKHFKRDYSDDLLVQHHFEGWMLPWTNVNELGDFQGFHIGGGPEKYYIEDHNLMPLKTVGDLKLAFYLMGQDLNSFKNGNSDN